MIWIVQLITATLLSLICLYKFNGIKKKDHGHKLLSIIEANLYTGHLNINLPHVLPHYDYFTDILVQIIQRTRKYGSKFQSELMSLRLCLKDELRFHTKWNKEQSKTYLQFIILICMSWMMLVFIKLLLNISFSILFIFVLFMVHLLLIVLTKIILNKIRVYYLGEFRYFRKFLICLRSMGNLSLSRQNLLLLSEASSLEHVQGVFLKNFKLKVEKFIKDTLMSGLKIDDEVKLLMDELTYLEQEAFEKSQKTLEILRWTSVVLVLFPSYLSIFYNIFKQMDKIGL